MRKKIPKPDRVTLFLFTMAGILTAGMFLLAELAGY
jgi:hypothetical protein